MRFTTKMSQSQLKIAWLIPSIARGYIWQPIFEEFTKIYPQNIIFSGDKPIFVSEDNSQDLKIKVVGKFRTIKFTGNTSNYRRGILLPSPAITYHLLKYLPDVIFTAAFSIWTIIAILLKPFTGWKIIIMYDGSSPEIDTTDSKFRIFVRKLLTRMSDAVITNTQAGRSYFVNYLDTENEKIFSDPFQVGYKNSLISKTDNLPFKIKDEKHPIFLYVGMLVKRKGVEYLLRACNELKKKGFKDFTILMLGDGGNRKEMEELSIELGLKDQIKWAGWVDYNYLGYYLEKSDVFVFPTLADTWGYVVTEAMVFSKPVISSTLAGATELISEGENGFKFDPSADSPELLAEHMSKFIENPELISKMGKNSEKKISSYTPKSIAQHLDKVINFVQKNTDRETKVYSQFSKS